MVRVNDLSRSVVAFEQSTTLVVVVEMGAKSWLVAGTVPAPATDNSNPPMEEISVYASRYAMESRVGEPRHLSGSDVEMVPGSHDDALHAVRSLPGMASNASGRPYIRGSLSEDILVRYDGIGLLDPFHLKNFQSLISAIDPAAIESIEVFSGGFPVQYGRRSGGVIDITAPTLDAGHEYRANLSLISGVEVRDQYAYAFFGGSDFSPYAGIERIVFADGTVWDKARIDEEAGFTGPPILFLEGTEDADELHGDFWHNEIVGLGGDDLIFMLPDTDTGANRFSLGGRRSDGACSCSSPSATADECTPLI